MKMNKQSQVTQTYPKAAGGSCGSKGQAPSRWVIFVIFVKTSYFNRIGSPFARVLEPFEKTRFLIFENHGKN